MSDEMENEEEGVSRSRSEEILSFNSNTPKPLKQRVASVDHRIFASVRPSLDSRIVGPEDKNEDPTLQEPIVKLSRISSSTALEPHEMALISEAIPETSTASFDDIETPLDTSEEIITPPKALNREMRNLQQSANSSKVLSNFLTNTDTPRRRKNKEQSNPSADIDSEMEVGTIETNSFASLDLELMDREVPLKHSPISANESDSTIVLQDETVKKRRKSLSRPRSRSRSRQGRKKSIAKMMNDELAVQSDKEENDENLEEIEDTLFAQPRTFDNRAPNPPPKPGWDSYCFKCHADNAVLSLACSRCKCSYHRGCVRPNPIPKNADEFVCPECQEMQAAEESDVNKFGHEKISEIAIKEMLVTILETIRTQTGRDFFENDIPFKHNKEQNPLIVTQMSYKTIEKRITNCYYKTTEAFLHDMRQLEHNWMLVDKNKAKDLKPVMKYIYGDINEMESCVHCYSSAFVIGNWFSAACLRPHLLVWAKLKGYPYWPAKVMSVDLDKQLADVRFFGAHDRANIPFHHCLIYSDKDPNKTGKGTPTNTKKGYAEALAETKEYIKNVTPEYGFENSVNREFLDPKRFISQLENQLPKWKNKRNQQITVDKEAVVPQKEKLTLKLIRTSDVTKSAEKTSKVLNHQDRHPLYRVLSNADPSESEKSPKSPSRRTTIDSEKSARSAKRTNKRVHSEASESNMSTTESIKSLSGKKNRDPSKKRKTQKTNGQEEPEQIRPRPPAPPTPNENVEEQLLEEIPTPKPVKRIRNRSRSTHPNDEAMPLIVSAKKPAIPPGTDEIHTLREGPGGAPRAKNRSRSLNRAASHERESGKKKARRSSAHPSSRSTEPDTEPLPHELSILRRRLSQSSTTSASRGRRPSRQKSIDAPPSNHEFPSIEIKSEPTSDIEEVLETSQVTINDIREIVGDNSRKRKTILISTSDNSNDGSLHSMRARKTFPNTIPSRSESRESSMARSQNPMVYIPQTFSTNNMNGHATSSSAPASRRNSRVSVSTEVPQDLPRLTPKPRGVFTQDGTNFPLESGAVSAVFSENAHRMTDYFKQLLIDTIGAASSGIPSAQIALLKLENEKLQNLLKNTKVECTLQVERLKQEHLDEIRVLRAAYEEKVKQIEENAKLDKKNACGEIRRICEVEKQKALDALKKDYKGKTWCSLCMKEARFYCCWNTSYCGTTCQREHWSQHQGLCRNTNTTNNNNTSVARDNPNKRNIAPTVSIAPSVSASSFISTIVPSTANVHYQNATMVTPVVRKPSIIAVQSINTPITSSQVEIRPQAQQTQIVLPANTIVQRFLTTAGGAHLNLQQLIETATLSPPALVPTNQPKKAPQPKTQKAVQKILPNSQQQPSLIVISRANSPPINIISTSSVSNVSATNSMLPST